MKFLKKYWSVGCLFLVWFVFCSPYFLKGLIPFPSTYLVSFFPPWNAYYGMPIKNNAMPDLITQLFPWKKLTVESWKLGQIPLWNPYSFSGTIHAGNYQSAVFSPVNILFFILPFIHGWSFSVLLQPLIAGLSLFLFLKLLKRSDMASLVGSLGFMFCGFLTTWMGYETLGWAIAFLPLSLAGIVLYDQKKNWWSGVLISFSVAFSLLSGHYQISFYALVAIALFISLFVRGGRSKLYVVFFVIAGILLCMDQLMLSFLALLQSNRASSFTSGSIPWNYLITLFSPDFYGNPVTRNDWFGQYAEWASYIGVIPLCFSVYSLISTRVKEKNIFILLAIISLLLAMSTPLNTLLYQLHIPVISTSVATRMVVLLSFSLAVLSAFGVDELRRDWLAQHTTKIKLTGVVLIGFALLLWSGILLFKFLPVESLIIAKRNTVIPTASLVIFVLSISVGMKLKRMRPLLLTILVVVTAGEMVRYSSKWMPFDSAAYIYPDLPVISFLKNTVKEKRVYGTFGNELDTYYGIPSVEGYDALYQQRYGEFISAAADGTIHELQRSVVQLDKQGKYTERWLELLGTQYLLYRKSDGRNVWVFPHWNYPQYRSIYQDEKYEVLENTKAIPRALLASEYKLAKSKTEILEAIESEQTNLQTTVVLEEKPEIEPKAGEGNVTILSYLPNYLEIRTSASSPKLLFISDVFDSGWHASVNGKEEKIFRANYAFRAVSVPSGDSTVRFWYLPKEFLIALIISAVTLGFIIIISVRKLIYDHRHL